MIFFASNIVLVEEEIIDNFFKDLAKSNYLEKWSEFDFTNQYQSMYIDSQCAILQQSA